jgi:hypothetical protein
MPISVQNLIRNPTNSSTSSIKLAKTATKALKVFPLHVISAFTKTSIRGRCIDFALCNTVASNNCSNIHTKT